MGRGWLGAPMVVARIPSWCIGFFSFLLLFTKTFFLASLFHILIAIYAGILFGIFRKNSFIHFITFIGPILGGALYSLNLQLVYAFILIYFLSGTIFIVKESLNIKN